MSATLSLTILARISQFVISEISSMTNAMTQRIGGGNNDYSCVYIACITFPHDG